MNEGEAWLISIVAAIVPTILYMLILRWFDRYEKEPRRLLLMAFVWGAVPAVILSMFGETILGQPLATLGESAAELMSSSVLAPVVEELTKGLAVFLLFLFFHREFDDVLDGIIYAATIGFGFAMTENVFYFARTLGEFGLEGLTIVVLMRAFVFGMNHALFTSVFGAALGHARITKQGCRRWVEPPLGLLGGMILHGVHNLFAGLSEEMCFGLVISAVSDWAGVLVMLAVVLLSARQEKRWIATYLRPEVESGLISQGEYDMIGSYRRRLAAQWRARFRVGQAEARRLGKLAQLATELAFKVQQGDARTAERLRGEITAVRGVDMLATKVDAGMAEKEDKSGNAL